MLRAVGIDQRAALESGEGVYVVAEANIKYRGSAKLDDELVVVSRVLEVRSASCVIHQRVMRGAEVLTDARSEEHTSELQSLMRISYAVFCLKKKKKKNRHNNNMSHY